MERKKGWHGNRHLGEMFVHGGWYYLARDKKKNEKIKTILVEVKVPLYIF